MASPARVAIYYAPAPGDPLTHLSAAWLGRDPITNSPVPQPEVTQATPVERQGLITRPSLAEITAEPRLYGFHATLKPPMRLAQHTTWTDFLAAVRTIAANIAPFDLPTLAVADLRGFLALRETSDCPALQALADTCVELPDRFRAPPSPDEVTRRRKANLTTEQDTMLSRWGYPYVFGTWFFHMTLTRRLSDAEKSVILPAAQAWFAPALAIPRRVEDICIFTQSAPGAAFTVAERIRLRG